MVHCDYLVYKIVTVYHKTIYKMKFNSYFDGKTQFSKIFLVCILFYFYFYFILFFFFLGGGGVGGGQTTACFTCGPIEIKKYGYDR